jgi:glycyl-tRNA synthetase beta chain
MVMLAHVDDPSVYLQAEIDKKDVTFPGRSIVVQPYIPTVSYATEALLSFFADRLKVHLRDQGIRHDVIQACFNLGGQDDLVLLVNRVRALQDFLGTEDGANLLTGYKRASNIVAAEEKKDGVEYSGAPDVKFSEQDEERALFAALDTAEPAIATALEAEDFAAAMAEMARLRPVIDAFFDKVTVNAENQIVRRNRLCLLTRIRAAMRQVAVWEAIEG